MTYKYFLTGVMAVTLLGMTTALNAGTLKTSNTIRLEDDANSVVVNRKMQMEVQGYSSRVLYAIYTGKLDLREDVVYLANQMHEATKRFERAFRQNTTGEKTRTKTRALEKIWQDWDGFMVAVKDYEQATARVAELANAGDIDGALEANMAVLNKCAGCHDVYRDPQR